MTTLLAKSWDHSDPTGWWISHKLDGVRMLWTGSRCLSRDGNQFHAPSWFTATLPTIALDGELWLGNQQFQATVSAVKGSDQEAWRRLRYMVFDAPEYGGAFEQRQDYLARLLEHSPHAEMLEQTRCQGIDHLRDELRQVEAQGGEGLMLRQPGSLYEAGRSSTLLKVKTWHDAEARVVKHHPGQGKHRGRLGALTVALDNGRSFNLGTGFTDADRASPPAIGSVVTFRFQELTKAGIPRFASFLRASPGNGPCEIPAEFLYRKPRIKPSKQAAPKPVKAPPKPRPEYVPYVNTEQMDVIFVQYEGNARQWSDVTRDVYCEACRRTGIKETTGVEWLLFLYTHANAAGCPHRAPLGGPEQLYRRGMWLHEANWRHVHALLEAGNAVLREVGDFSVPAPQPIRLPRQPRAASAGDPLRFLFGLVRTVNRFVR